MVAWGPVNERVKSTKTKIMTCWLGGAELESAVQRICKLLRLATGQTAVGCGLEQANDLTAMQNHSGNQFGATETSQLTQSSHIQLLPTPDSGQAKTSPAEP